MTEMPVMTAVALGCTIGLFAALTVLQSLLIAGRPLGHYAWGGRHRVLPRRLRIASTVAILLYALFTVLLLSRAGVLPGGDTAPIVAATWVLLAYIVLGILGNLASRSRSERVVQTPVSIALTLGILVIALNGPR